MRPCMLRTVYAICQSFLMGWGIRYIRYVRYHKIECVYGWCEGLDQKKRHSYAKSRALGS